MELASKEYLQQRGTAWIFRRRVPPNLQRLIGKTEWKKALGTPVLREALQRRNELAAETDREIHAARAELSRRASPPLTTAEAEEFANEWLGGVLRFDEEMRIARGAAWTVNIDKALEATAGEARQALAEMDWRAKMPEAVAILRKRGRWYEDGDESLVRLAVELLKARVRVDQLMEQRQAGEIVDAPLSVGTAPPRPPPAGITVKALIGAYRKAREAEHGAESTARKYNHVFRALEEALGSDLLVRSVTRTDCRAVRDLLRRVPVRASKRFPGLSLADAADASEAAGGASLAPSTVDIYLENLSAVMNFAVKEGWAEANPAAGLRTRSAPTVRRRGFTNEELPAVFDGLAGFRQSRPWRFWVPALALYTGARAGELCQLIKSDVVTTMEGSYLDLSLYDADGVRADKRLKTRASERRVPLHPGLISSGFLVFVAGISGGADRLFPELNEGPNGGFSHGLTRWWARYLDGIKLDAPSLTFHSFRHGFADAGRRAGLAGETIDALGGWAAVGQRAQYGDRAAMARDIAKIEYGEFALPD
jgi:integrase